MRLDKFLVETGVGSRSQVKSLLKKKAILVNQEVETSPKVQINEHKDVVTYLGKPLTYEAFVYYVLNKPAGFLSATKDRAQATVIDLLDETARQKDVFVAGIMTEADKDDFAKGISLKDYQCLPAKLEVLDKDVSQETCVVSIIIQEGKFHQVKRMVAACGKEVLELQRLSMGPLRLDPSLAEGDFRRLTSEELQSLEAYCQSLL